MAYGPAARSARLSPEDESLDRSRTGYRISNDSDSRRAHPRDRDASPVKDDSSRRVLRRDDYPAYDSLTKVLGIMVTHLVVVLGQ
jgi:hypothetical protein